jgi:Raf kinase inhibitor-like YbhB/YbcL family protein
MILQRWIGRALRSRRAGEERLVWHHPAIAAAPISLELTSASIAQDQTIPLAHAGKGVGDNVSPALRWGELPRGTRELLLIVEDADAPLPRPFVHAIAGITPELSQLPEGALNPDVTPGIWLGLNSFGRAAYAGPRALPAHGPHRYSFQMFALDRKLEFDQAPRLKEVLSRLDGAVLARGRLDGIFERL